MEPIEITKRLDGPIKELPELDPFVGREVVITVRDNPAAEPDTTDAPRPPKRAGFAKGMIQMAPDFDAPLDDFKDYM